MDVYHAEVFYEERFTLGECPVWDERASRLYWADIKGNRVHSADGSGFHHRSQDFGQNVGCFALDVEGGLILGLTSGLYRLRVDGRYQRLPLTTSPLTRFNDGKCDPMGRFWCGGTDLFEGGNTDLLRARMAELIRSGVTVLCLLALSDDGAPVHDRAMAADLAELGATVLACTPERFPDVLASALERR